MLCKDSDPKGSHGSSRQGAADASISSRLPGDFVLASRKRVPGLRWQRPNGPPRTLGVLWSPASREPRGDGVPKPHGHTSIRRMGSFQPLLPMGTVYSVLSPLSFSSAIHPLFLHLSVWPVGGQWVASGWPVGGQLWRRTWQEGRSASGPHSGHVFVRSSPVCTPAHHPAIGPLSSAHLPGLPGLGQLPEKPD